MPYIEQAQRDELDPHIQAVVTAVKQLPKGPDGPLNYCITKLVCGVMLDPKQSWSPEHKSYMDLGRAVMALEMAKLELYRRMAAPYEDRKAQDNGDVYAY